jgi:excisionase family DNA binding protein
LPIPSSLSKSPKRSQSTPNLGESGDVRALYFLSDSTQVKPLVVPPLQACKLLSISMGGLYNLLNQGVLDSFRVGGSRRITLASIERFVADRVAKGRCPAATGRLS